jgi:phosphate transport system substrate-binding protein
MRERHHLPHHPLHHPRRHVLRWLCALPVVPALLPVLAHAQARQPGELLAGGTGAGLGPAQRLLEGTPKLRFVPNLGTSGGLKAVAAGAIDLALSARRLNDAEKAQGLVEREFFSTPVVFAVHADVPLRRATLAELVALYAGRTPQWSSGAPVRLVLRPETDSDSRFLAALSPAMAEAQAAARARPGAHVATTDADATEALARINGSLGLTTLGLVRADNRGLRVLELDGVMPDAQTLATKRYPHGKTIYWVTRGEPAPAALAVLQATTTRPARQSLLELGCIAAAVV